jgi:hypothetical protein
MVVGRKRDIDTFALQRAWPRDFEAIRLRHGSR